MQISIKFPRVPINIKLALVHVMTWHQTGDRSLSEPMMAYVTDEYMRHLELLIGCHGVTKPKGHHVDISIVIGVIDDCQKDNLNLSSQLDAFSKWVVTSLLEWQMA